MSLLALLNVACLALLAVLLVAAAAQDLRTMQIADGFSLAIAGLFVVWGGIGLGAGQITPLELAMAFGCGLAVFLVSAAAFAVGALGGGDVKLLGAVSLFAGPQHLLDFLFVASIAGGVLALAILAGAPIGGPGAVFAGPLRARLRSHLSFGPAIAVGGLWLAASLWLK